MPELNVLIGAADYSTQSDQPLMKSIRVRITAVAGSGESDGLPIRSGRPPTAVSAGPCSSRRS
jgi:hypothetical protein